MRCLGKASLISDVRDLKEVRQEILWVLGRRQGTFQAEGTAIPFPGLCLEASPGTCTFPGRVCVCVCTRARRFHPWLGRTPHAV